MPPAMSRTFGPRPTRAGQDAVGTLDEDARPDRHALEGPDQSPSSLIVIRSQAPLGADEIENGMGAPPAVAGQEPPHEVLAGPDRELVEVAPGDVDREDAGALLDDVRDAQPMPRGQPDRLADAEDEDERGGDDVERDPVADRDRVVDEVGADEDLVEEAERDREVGVEVEPVPRLVRQAAARGTDRGDRHEPEQRAADDRHQDVRVGRHERDASVDDVAAVAERIAR